MGQEFADELLQHSQAQIITQKRANMLKQVPKQFSLLIGKVSKIIETFISQLTDIFNIASIKARSYHRFLGRINRKILAYTKLYFLITQLLKNSLLNLNYSFKLKKVRVHVTL